MDGPIMRRVQSKLSEFQAVPVVGPLIGSPIKATVSTVQAVAGLGAAIILAPVAAVTKNEKVIDYTCESFGQCGYGVMGLAYSIANIVTLGILGYKVEHS